MHIHDVRTQLKMRMLQNLPNSHPHPRQRVEIFMKIMLSGLLNFIKFQIHAHLAWILDFVLYKI